MKQTSSQLARRFAFFGLLLLAGFVVGASGAQGAELLGIRTGSHGDAVRVVCDLQGDVECHLQQEGEGAWSILLKGLCRSPLPKRISKPHILLTAIEGRCVRDDLRIDLKGAKPLSAKGFRVPAGDGKPDRYVVDLTPTGVTGTSPTAEERSDTSSVAPVPQPPPLPADPKPLPRRSGKWRILVDPGHGGNDPGATRKGLQEKEIVLDVARRVSRILNETDGFEARLSRNDDRRVPLRQRFVAAEKFDADAFVSIHVNASKTRAAYGVEVFFLSMGGASDEASKELANLENEADPEYVVQEDSLLQGIPFSFDLRQSDTLLRSSRLAESVLESFEVTGLAASRGVKQAGFAVLKSFQVPSILVETGFISNPDEAQRLKDPKHRDRLAACIAEGTVDYFEKFARARTETNTGER